MFQTLGEVSISIPSNLYVPLGHPSLQCVTLCTQERYCMQFSIRRPPMPKAQCSVQASVCARAALSFVLLTSCGFLLQYSYSNEVGSKQHLVLL